MREITFRGKRTANGEWVYGDLIHRQIWSSKTTVIRVSDDGFDSYEEYEVILETVGQFTGLTDKHGKKIFEGDIIKSTDGIIGIVQWFEEHLAFMVWDRTYNRIGFLYEVDCSGIEVIGTIFENPELLEVHNDK